MAQGVSQSAVSVDKTRHTPYPKCPQTVPPVFYRRVGFIAHIKAAKKFSLRTLMSPAPPPVEPPAPPPRKNVILPSGSDHEDVEDEEDYRHGGYHPVRIGDEFSHHRYRVIRKLGWGHFSTVWLALDTAKSRHVALKIVKSEAKYRDAAEDEIKILRKAAEEIERSPHANHVVHLLDDFVHAGPNGEHVCMVFEVLGENLLKVIRRYEHNGLPLFLVKRIVEQVLRGLDLLHRECGIIHTDLKPENVLVCLRPDSDDIERTLHSVSLHDSAGSRPSSHCSVAARYEQAPVDVKIADLGNACWTHRHFTSDIQTRQYRAPEVILGSSYDTSADIWSLACMAYELVTGDFLFAPRSGKRYSKDEGIRFCYKTRNRPHSADDGAAWPPSKAHCDIRSVLARRVQSTRRASTHSRAEPEKPGGPACLKEGNAGRRGAHAFILPPSHARV